MLAVTHDCYDVGKCIGQTLYLTCSRPGESTTIVCPLEHGGHKFPRRPGCRPSLPASLCLPADTVCTQRRTQKTTSRSDMARDVFNEPAPPTTTKKQKTHTHTHKKIQNLVDMVQKYYSDGITLYSLCIKQRRVCPPKSFHYSMFIWDFACGSQCVSIHCCIVSASN